MNTEDLKQQFMTYSLSLSLWSKDDHRIWYQRRDKERGTGVRGRRERGDRVLVEHGVVGG